MSKFKLPYGMFCAKHPNYKAMREPRGECPICNFLWVNFGNHGNNTPKTDSQDNHGQQDLPTPLPSE